MTMVKDFYAGLVLASLLAVASCDRGAETPAQTASAVTTTLPPVASPDAAETAPAAEARSDDPREQAIPAHDTGAPLWSANSRNTAQENAQRLYERNGKAFGAKSVDEYVDMAHAFVSDPPAGTLRLTRDNGDRLFYDPKANTFAVVTREGAPRTMFKPDEGMTYWREQEKNLAQREAADSDDDASGGRST